MSEKSKSLKNQKISQTCFWDKDGYRVDVDRITENVQQLDLMNKFFVERAEVEAEYAKKLRQWKQKYQTAFAKSSMYGSHKQSCSHILEQTEPLSIMHDQMSKLLLNDCSARLQEWKRGSYHAKVFGGYKEHDTLNKEFVKGQKSWLKMNDKVTKQKKVFHQLSAQQIRTPTEAVELEERLAQDKYNLLLDELQQVAPVYVGEMKRVHQKAQNIEKRKIQFLEDILSAFVAITDLTKYTAQINVMGKVGLEGINMIHTSNDLEEWNKMIGFDQPLAVAGFEPYEPEPPTSQNTNNNNNTVSRASTLSRASIVSQGSTNGSIYGGSVKRISSITVPENSSDVTDEVNGLSRHSSRSSSVKVYAMYDYKARDGDEIDLAQGTEFECIEDEDTQGWCRGRLNSGKEGLYPAKYAANM